MSYKRYLTVRWITVLFCSQETVFLIVVVSVKNYLKKVKMQLLLVTFSVIL